MGSVAPFVSLRCLSMIATEDDVFYDPAADTAMNARRKEHLHVLQQRRLIPRPSGKEDDNAINRSEDAADANFFVGRD